MERCGARWASVMIDGWPTAWRCQMTMAAAAMTRTVLITATLRYKIRGIALALLISDTLLVLSDGLKRRFSSSMQSVREATAQCIVHLLEVQASTIRDRAAG